MRRMFLSVTQIILSSYGVFCFPAALQADGQEVASVVSTQEIRVVAELLQISPEGLQKAITYKVTVSVKSNQILFIYIPIPQITDFPFNLIYR